MPVSSSNSRRAVATASSPSAISPFGSVQAPRSLFAQSGPPGWASRTSRAPSRRRNISRPALVRGIARSGSVHVERTLIVADDRVARLRPVDRHHVEPHRRFFQAVGGGVETGGTHDAAALAEGHAVAADAVGGAVALLHLDEDRRLPVSP